MSFVEVEPPELSLFFSIKEQNKQTNIDYCPHLITSCRSLQNEDVLYVIFMAKQGFLTIITLEQGCVLAKNNFQVVYSYTCKVTMIKAEIIKNKIDPKKENKNQHSIYLFLGFDDGTISMYTFIQNGVKPFIQVLKYKPNLKRKQPVINVSVIKTDLLIVCSYSLFILKKLLDRQNQASYLLNSKRKSEAFFQKSINVDINSCKLDVDIDWNSNHLYIFNEHEGAVSLDLETMQQYKRVQDCTKILKICQKIIPKQAKITITGGTDDAIKFIDYNSNIVVKYTGIKNYPSCFYQDNDNKMLWVGDLHGSITCFQYINTKVNKKQSFVMLQIKLKYSEKICENGIKKIMVHKNLLIVFDCNHDIFFFDIIKPLTTTERESSNNQST